MVKHARPALLSSQGLMSGKKGFPFETVADHVANSLGSFQESRFGGLCQTFLASLNLKCKSRSPEFPSDVSLGCAAGFQCTGTPTVGGVSFSYCNL